MVHNPLIRNQFISVQQVTRLKQLDLGYPEGGPHGEINNGGDAAKLEKQKAMSFGIEALLGNQMGGAKEMVLGDRGKGVYKYEYETCKTSGPTSGPGFTDPDKKIQGMGDGAFEQVEVEDHKSLGTQGVIGDDSELVREYLIIAFWRYDS